MSRGIDRERDVRELLEHEGWIVVRAAGSLGPVDLVALRQDRHIRENRVVDSAEAMFVEVKSTSGGPYERFQPADRKLMKVLALRAGARPVLAWWPKCKPGQRKGAALRWIEAEDWPNNR